MSLQVVHNTGMHRFEWEQDGYLAVAEYKMRDGVMVFTHTLVPPELEGRGIAAQLARYALEYARGHHLYIHPVCPYFKTYIARHPEYKDLMCK